MHSVFCLLKVLILAIENRKQSPATNFAVVVQIDQAYHSENRCFDKSCQRPLKNTWAMHYQTIDVLSLRRKQLSSNCLGGLRLEDVGPRNQIGMLSGNRSRAANGQHTIPSHSALCRPATSEEWTMCTATAKETRG
jgi:hypothetical protein